MKIFSTILFLTLLYGLAKAQENDHRGVILQRVNAPKTACIKLNFLSAAYATLNLSYERMIDYDKSVQFGIALSDLTDRSSNNQGISIRCARITFDYRHYYRSLGPLAGKYIQPFVRFSQVTFENGVKDSINFKNYVYTEHLTQMDFGCVLGKQRVYKNKWVFDAFWGIYVSSTLYNDSDYSKHIGSEDYINVRNLPFFFGFGIRPGLKIGYLL